MIATPMASLLNGAQRNRVVTVLRSLELDLRQARAALDAAPQQGILYRTSLSVPAERRAAIAAEIDAALSDIAVLASELHLPVTELDPAPKMSATFSVAWADLVDSTSTTLRRYGSVDERLSEVLDEHMEQLSGRALAIAHLYRQGGRG